MEKGAVMSDVTVTVAPIPGKRNRFNVYINGEMDAWTLLQAAIQLVKKAQALTLMMDEKGERINR